MENLDKTSGFGLGKRTDPPSSGSSSDEEGRGAGADSVGGPRSGLSGGAPVLVAGGVPAMARPSYAQAVLGHAAAMAVPAQAVAVPAQAVVVPAEVVIEPAKALAVPAIAKKVPFASIAKRVPAGTAVKKESADTKKEPTGANAKEPTSANAKEPAGANAKEPAGAKKGFFGAIAKKQSDAVKAKDEPATAKARKRPDASSKEKKWACAEITGGQACDMWGYLLEEDGKLTPYSLSTDVLFQLPASTGVKGTIAGRNTARPKPGSDSKWTLRDLLIPSKGDVGVHFIFAHSMPNPDLSKSEEGDKLLENVVNFRHTWAWMNKHCHYSLGSVTFKRLVDCLSEFRYHVLILGNCQSFHAAEAIMKMGNVKFLITFGDESESGYDGVSILFLSEFILLFISWYTLNMDEESERVLGPKFTEILGSDLTVEEERVVHAFAYAIVEIGRMYYCPDGVEAKRKKDHNGESHCADFFFKTYKEAESRKKDPDGMHHSGIPKLHYHHNGEKRVISTDPASELISLRTELMKDWKTIIDAEGRLISDMESAEGGASSKDSVESVQAGGVRGRLRKNMWKGIVPRVAIPKAAQEAPRGEGGFGV